MRPQQTRTRHPRWRRALSLLPAAALTVAATISATTTGTAVAAPAPPSGFSLTWSDDFNGAAGTGIDQGLWKYDTGPGSNFGTGEIETMTSSTSNVYYDGQGHLVLQALHSGSDPRAGWTSGRVETQSAAFGAPAGGVVRIESVLQQPDVTTSNGAGYWPAFWMLGAPLRDGVTWPKSGEIDVMEDINGRSSVFSTIHCGVNPGGPCNESTGIGSGERACPGCQSGFHDYATEIDRSVSPEQIRFYLDGNNFYTVNANQVDATTWANAIDHPFFIIYDLAIGGGFPDAFGGGPNAATVSGGKLIVDSVAVYNKGPGSGGGGGTVTGQTITGPGGKCVDVAGDDTGGDGTAVQLWDCQSGAKDQHWTWSGQTLQTLGRCLDIAGGNSAGPAAGASTRPRAPPPTAPGCRSGTATAPAHRSSPSAPRSTGRAASAWTWPVTTPAATARPCSSGTASPAPRTRSGPGAVRPCRPSAGAWTSRAATAHQRPVRRLALGRHRQRHPAADLGLQRLRRTEVRPGLSGRTRRRGPARVRAAERTAERAAAGEEDPCGRTAPGP